MLEDDPHHAYRELLRRTALAIAPDASRQDAEIGERLRRLREHLKTGASYDKLSQDLQFARNPALVSTHKNKTRRRLSRTVEQASKAAAEATADALAKNLVADQARLELELFDSAEPLAEDIPQSRENPGEDGYNLRYLKRFIGQLDAHEVSRSGIQTAPSYALSHAAEMIGWAVRDPEFEDPQNPIPHLDQAGFSHVWRAEMTDEEALWIDRAASLDRARVIEEIRRVFGIDLPPDYPMSSAMLMGMARIADADNPMARIDWNLLRAAGEKVEANEVAFVQASLGLDDTSRASAQAIVSFLKHRVEDEAIRNFEISVPFGLIRLMIDELDPAGSETEDWVPRFCEKIQALAEQLAPIVRSEEVFFALTHAAYEQSFAKVKFGEMDAVKRANDRHRRNMESLDDALASGLQFKFRSDGMAILEDDPQYHLISQRPMTRETYMASSAIASNEDSSPMSGSSDEPDSSRPEEEENADIERSADPGAAGMTATSQSPSDRHGDPSNSVDAERPERKDAVLKTQNSPSPYPRDVTASDTVDAASKSQTEQSLPVNDLIDDRFDDEDADDYDWQNENPDLEPINLDLGPDLDDDHVPPGEPSGDHQPDKPDEPADMLRSGATAELNASPLLDRPAGRPPRPQPYKPEHDHEEDDWNE